LPNVGIAYLLTLAVNVADLQIYSICVDMRFRPSCGYIHGYYAVAPANKTEYFVFL